MADEWEKLSLDDALPRLEANDPTLTCLSLFRNKVGDGGAVRLADGLRRNTALKKLNLGVRTGREERTLAVLWRALVVTASIFMCSSYLLSPSRRFVLRSDRAMTYVDLL
eukprot:TRINITY_DN737_c0_g1_i8.p2 TRINITY_DN737_c0_g1~~TRINITY_DN737_c0_g1_i8.p2  ORF type:complete len:110 (-),score=9.37 TRINITY_DN737_c0_g1_i8:296-625(-)